MRYGIILYYEGLQWRIQLYADRAPPIDQNLRLFMAARSRLTVCLRPWGKFSLKSLTFGHFLCENGQKAFSSAPRPRWGPGLCPQIPF